jgi:hypothetical protein
MKIVSDRDPRFQDAMWKEFTRTSFFLKNP